jgi:hypothetical protein
MSDAMDAYYRQFVDPPRCEACRAFMWEDEHDCPRSLRNRVANALWRLVARAVVTWRFKRNPRMVSLMWSVLDDFDSVAVRRIVGL